VQSTDPSKTKLAVREGRVELCNAFFLEPTINLSGGEGLRWPDRTVVVALLDRGATGRELIGRSPIIFLLSATDKYYGYPNAWLTGKGKHRLEYALVAHNSPWEKARIPQMAWEYNCPPVIVPDRARAPARSFVHTSRSVIVEAVRREGAEIELRLAECLGRPGIAEVELALPHREAALTDLRGGHGITLAPGPSYRFPIHPQQIVTLRFRTDRPVEQVKPLMGWESLVPEAKRAAFNTRSDKRGHPPRGDVR